MTKQELNNYRAVVKNITRASKKELEEIIKSTSLSKEELKVIVPSLLPPFTKDFGIAISDYKMAVETIAIAIYYTNNQKEANEECLTASYEIIEAVISAFKEERKPRENLYIKAIKTNLTEEQFKYFTELMHSYNYKSAAAFLRDVAINQIDVKPNNHEEFVSYFRETKKLVSTLEDIADDLEDGNSNKELTRIIRELISNISNTRKLAIDSHSSATATSLAKKYLNAKQLKALYLEALDKESNL
ncbi:chromosome partitioning protein ParA [Vibrio splendidus]|uniref:chromosome partitioning protein ParA n=1 Tax=uncultured Vibrio sp. TaxID=114054 RepID=UPI0026347F01|nr:chromosome partitioning protein ParA [uncultured Vibrio sp.]